MDIIDRKIHYYNKRRFGGNREKALKRDFHRCKKCGSQEGIIVHHKNGISDNSLENLITLCRKCHFRIHTQYSQYFLDERAIAMLSLKKEGMKLEYIGKEFGISRQRVHQIIRRITTKSNNE